MNMCKLDTNADVTTMFIQVIDFTVPIFHDNYKLFMLKPPRSISWTTFSDIFDSMFWLVILSSGILLVGVIFIVFHYTTKVRINNACNYMISPLIILTVHKLNKNIFKLQMFIDSLIVQQYIKLTLIFSL